MWITFNWADISSISITDNGLFPDGFTGPIIPPTQGFLPAPNFFHSRHGITLDSGFVADTQSARRFEISQPSTVFTTDLNDSNLITGVWTVSTSVPEPASAVPAGIAIAIGLGLAAFRKRKEARRQRPVGPLGANQ